MNRVAGHEWDSVGRKTAIVTRIATLSVAYGLGHCGLRMRVEVLITVTLALRLFRAALQLSPDERVLGEHLLHAALLLNCLLTP
jgi:hypothetical protein